MRMMMVVCIAALCATGVCAQSMDDSIERGIALHDRALAEGEATALKCRETLEPFIKTNMVARAYYGSVITIHASFYADENPVHSLTLLEEGAQYMDSAVANDPDNGELRLIRLSNGLEVSRSSPLKRYAVIADDVHWFENHPLPSSPEYSAAILFNCGLYHLDAGDIETALDALETCVESGAETAAVQNARDILRRYEE